MTIIHDGHQSFCPKKLRIRGAVVIHRFQDKSPFAFEGIPISPGRAELADLLSFIDAIFDWFMSRVLVRRRNKRVKGLSAHEISPVWGRVQFSRLKDPWNKAECASAEEECHATPPETEHRKNQLDEQEDSCFAFFE
jgi:hypothetical protein